MSLAYSWKHCRQRFRWYFLETRKCEKGTYRLSISIPDETMAVAASLALARTSSKLARPGVPNVVVTHPGGFSSSALSEEEPKNLSSQLLPHGLLVVHDASRGGQHHLTKLSGGQQVVRPLLDVVDGNVEPAFEVNLRSVF